jgi:hypothetical protein
MNDIYVNRIERQVCGLEEATGRPRAGQKANVINRSEGFCRGYEILLTLSLCLALCDATSCHCSAWSTAQTRRVQKSAGHGQADVDRLPLALV